MLEELGLKLIKLDLPFRLNHVNCFMAEGENGWKIIDAGVHDNKTAIKWGKELAEKTITDILVTHYHPDHFGYVGGLQQRTGARVSMPEIDAKTVETIWEDDFIVKLQDTYSLLGIPNDIARKMGSFYQGYISIVTPYPKVEHYLQEGEKILLGKYEYEVIFTPGHSNGLITFYNKERNVLLSTDHILPRITPNIAYWFHGNPNPLADFLQSLEKIKKLDVDFVIPSHGKPFYGANERIEEIINHHNDRLAETLESINYGGTAYEVFLKLFGEIDIHGTRSAMGETLSHLEFLIEKGECKRELKNGQWWYYI